MEIKEEFQEKFDRIINALHKCIELNKTDYLVEMSKEELETMYNFFEEGLIDYNLVLQKYPDQLTWSLKLQDRELEKMLEGKLLEIACKSLKVDSSQEMFDKYWDSSWSEKLKEKKYCDKICEFAGVPESLRDKFYENYFL